MPAVDGWWNDLFFRLEAMQCGAVDKVSSRAVIFLCVPVKACVWLLSSDGNLFLQMILHIVRSDKGFLLDCKLTMNTYPTFKSLSLSCAKR